MCLSKAGTIATGECYRRPLLRAPSAERGGNGTPAILGTYEVHGISDASGLATRLPSVRDVRGYRDVVIKACAGPVSRQFDLNVVAALPEAGSKKNPERGERKRPPTRGRMVVE